MPGRVATSDNGFTIDPRPPGARPSLVDLKRQIDQPEQINALLIQFLA
jgi:hypothetical protein